MTPPVEETFGPGSDESQDTKGTTALAHAAPAAFSGEFEASDLNIPFLSVRQKMSKDEVPGREGDVSIEKEFVVLNKDTKVLATVVSVRKFWKTDPPFDSGDFPKIVHTKEEADRLKDDEEDNPDGYNVIHAAEIIVLIPYVEGACPLTDEEEVAAAFPYQDEDGNRYLIGKFTAQKKGYDTTFKRIFTWAKANKGVPLDSVQFNLSTTKVMSGKNTWYVFNAAPAGKATPAATLNLLASLRDGGDDE